MRLVGEILAWLLLAVGLVWMVLPTPFGFVLVGLGLALLISTNRRAAKWFRRLRARVRTVDKTVREAEKHLPKEARRPFEETDPDKEARQKKEDGPDSAP
ncbi:MAG: hypothetical protein H6923_10545 [Alphaproteobacteria bacterium]|nr:hypothetical protein [Alphaproteobacteria bacterium]